MSGIRFEQLEKSFDQQKVLEPLSLTIKEGEFIVLVGPSGCGKTTFLRLIAGLEEATKGSIFMDEKDVTLVESKDRGVAMVFQNYALYPHMTVEENLCYPLNIIKLPKREKSKRIEEVSKILEIDQLLQRKPKQLSGGQKQRVAIGRALVRNPDVFLFDEPLSNLDARLREQMRLEIARLHKKLKRTTVYVTHDQHEAMSLGDRIVVMNKGKIMEVGSSLELYHNPQTLFVARFLGNPPINIIEGQFEENTFTGNFGKLRLKSPKQISPNLTLGIRPEDLNLSLDFDKADLTGDVILAEHLGGESHYHIRCKKTDLLVISRNHSIKIGDQVGIVLNPTKTLWFNSKTELRIY